MSNANEDKSTSSDFNETRSPATAVEFAPTATMHNWLVQCYQLTPMSNYSTSSTIIKHYSIKKTFTFNYLF